MKKIIRLTESDLHGVIENSVKRIIREGFFNKKKQDKESDDIDEFYKNADRLGLKYHKNPETEKFYSNADRLGLKHNMKEGFNQYSDDDFASDGDPYELGDDDIDPISDVSHIKPNDLRRVYVWDTGDSYYEFEADYGEGMSEAVSFRGTFDGDFQVDDVILGHSGFGHQMNPNDLHTTQFEDWFNSTLGEQLAKIIDNKIRMGDFANDAQSGY